MDIRQFCTDSDAKTVLAEFGPIGFSGVLFTPKYGMDVPAPQYDETHKMWMIAFGNGFISNVGLLLNSVAELGNLPAAKDALKAEMKERGLMTAWWV